MRYQPIHIPGHTPTDRGVRWLGHSIETGLRHLSDGFVDAKTTTTVGTLSGDGCIFAFVDVPEPPASALLHITGFFNCYLASGSAVDAMVSLEAGGSVLATARCYVQSPGTQSVALEAWYEPRERVSCACRVKSISGSTALDLYARGIAAFWYTEA